MNIKRPKLGQRFIKWLYMKYVAPDLSAITREQLNGKLIEHTDFESLTKARQQEIIKSCLDLLQNDVLDYIAKEQIKNHSEHILFQSKDETESICSRFSINGIDCLFDKIREYAQMSEEVQDKFNKFETI